MNNISIFIMLIHVWSIQLLRNLSDCVELRSYIKYSNIIPEFCHLYIDYYNKMYIIKVKYGKDVAKMANDVLGGWVYDPNMQSCGLPQEAASAFCKAIEGLVGVSYEPAFYVASQLVSGYNYCIICKTTMVTNPPVPGCKIVYIYADKNGNAKITRVEDVIK